MLNINYVGSVIRDLADMRASDRKRVLDRIEEELTHRPTQETRNKKIILGLKPPWDHEEPTWELRVGEFPVFYDVNLESDQVTVRAVRHKPPHKTTEEIL